MKTVVVSFIADDKPGLVNTLSTTITDHGGNWLESNLSQLAGKFAGVIVVTLAADNTAPLMEALKSLNNQGISVVIEHSDPNTTLPEYQTAILDLVGHDKPGIVRDISNTLSTLGVNLAALETELTPGSMSSELLFKASGELQIPTTVDLGELQDALEQIATDLMVDIALT